MARVEDRPAGKVSGAASGQCPDGSPLGRGERAARYVIETLGRRSQTVAAAESCTSGLVADLFARIPGASRVFWGSFVTYMVDAKVRILGLDPQRVERCGPVSRETACDMALGALEKSGADYAVAVTGLAGPGGDGTGVPVGTVWIAAAGRGRAFNAYLFHFEGSRKGIREQAALEALEVLSKQIQQEGGSDGSMFCSPA